MSVNNYVNISKLIESFKKEGLITEDDKQLNIIFDKWMESKTYKDSWSVQILSFSVVRSDKTLNDINYEKFVKSVGENIRYLNIGKQLNKDLKKLSTKQKEAHKIMICLKKVDTDSYSYYPMRLSEAKINNYDKLVKERRDVIENKVNDFEFYDDV